MQTEVKRKKEAWKRYIQTKNQQDRIEYNERKNTVKKIREAKRKSWEEFGEQLNESFKIIERAFWDKIRALRGEKMKQIRGMRKTNQLKTKRMDILENPKAKKNQEM